MYKFGPSVPYALSESPQQNDLRWEILLRDGDTFTPQTAMFRCKDFFNDIVALYHGTTGVIYGMDTRKIKVNEEGVWVRLYAVENRDDVFVKNIENIINVELMETMSTRIELEQIDTNVFLLFLPRVLFDHNWYISLTTYLIRNSNYGVLYESFDQFVNSPRREADHMSPLVRKYKFTLPAGLEGTWYYYNHAYNSNKKSHPMSMIHNAGMVTVCDYYKEPTPCAATAATTF